MDGTLVYGLATLGAGILGLLVRYSFRSKCTDVSMCFGCFRIQRDVNAELEEEKIETKNDNVDTLQRSKSSKYLDIESGNGTPQKHNLNLKRGLSL